MDRGFSVVFVCTGNRARSPFAEALLHRRLGSSGVGVESFGTLDLGPVPALPEAIAAAARLGIDLRAHRARALERGLEERALVLGFEPAHVAAAVVDGGARRERTFTVAELAELLTDHSVTGASPDDIVLRAHAHRRTSPLAAPAIPDPLGTSPDEFRGTFERIDSLVGVIATGLFGGDPGAPQPPPDRTGGRFARLRRLR